jgi:dimeric dUTPase (all-alpha-NTP-PPase superfamily)
VVSLVVLENERMDLEKLFQMQQKLDQRIIDEHDLEKSLFINKILALDVEVSELANEWQGFKHWKVNPQPKLGMLEEYVDGLHFVLSIGLEIDFPIGDWEIGSIPSCDGVAIQILEIKTALMNIYQRFALRYSTNCEQEYIELLEMYIGLGEMLGFTEVEIEQAYLDKNAINHQRQDQGY